MLLLVPSDGTMWVDGMDTKEDEHLWMYVRAPEWYSRIRITRSSEQSLRKTCRIWPENLGAPTEEIWQRVEDSLKAVGMIEYRHHSPNKLSGGKAEGCDRRCHGNASKVYCTG